MAKAVVQEGDILALLDKETTGADYFRIEKLGDRKYDVRPRQHAFLKDFQSYTFVN